jgi:hypothetical protein
MGALDASSNRVLCRNGPLSLDIAFIAMQAPATIF